MLRISRKHKHRFQFRVLINHWPLATLKKLEITLFNVKLSFFKNDMKSLKRALTVLKTFKKTKVRTQMFSVLSIPYSVQRFPTAWPKPPWCLTIIISLLEHTHKGPLLLPVFRHNQPTLFWKSALPAFHLPWKEARPRERSWEAAWTSKCPPSTREVGPTGGATRGFWPDSSKMLSAQYLTKHWKSATRK